MNQRAQGPLTATDTLQRGNQDLPDEVSFLLTFGLWHVLVAAGFGSRPGPGTQEALRKEVI